MTAEGELERRRAEGVDSGDGRPFGARLRDRLLGGDRPTRKSRPTRNDRQTRNDRPTGARSTEGRFGDLDPRLHDGAGAQAGIAGRRQLLRARLRRSWRSPLTRRILALNVLVLVIPVLGLLHLDTYRQGLIAAELDGLSTQARAFSLSLGSAGVATGNSGQEELVPEITRSLMRLLLIDVTVRARVFARDGHMIADSFLLQGPGGSSTTNSLMKVATL